MKEKLTTASIINQGFTLIEIVAVLVILGTITSIVVKKSGNFSMANAVTTETETLKYNLRYAQMMSMNTKADEIWQITFPNDSTYKLQQYNSTTTSWDNKNLPGKTSETHTLSNSTATVRPTVRFDSWGTPVQSDRTTAEASNLTLTMSDGTYSKSITVTKNTGFTYLP